MIDAGSEPEAAASCEEGRFDLQHVVAGRSFSVPLVPVDGVFEGQVAILGETRIEGTVRGTLRGSGRLELGPDGRIEGSIECAEVRSQGAIVGLVVAHGRIHLRSGARMLGDLETPRLEVSDSAIWNGVARVGH
jgi:cytoskeletal protein CcmA (bactofilin family)